MGDTQHKPSAARLGALFLSAWALAVGCGAGRAHRPTPDKSAIREALATDSEPRYASSRAYSHYLQSMLASYDEDLVRAIEQLRLAIVFDPETAYLRVSVAQLLVRVGAADQALGELEQAVHLAPSYAPAHLTLGRLRLEQRRYRLAIASLERAISLDKAEPQGYLALAQAHLEEGDEPKAIAAIEALSQAQPGEPMGYRALGRWFSEKGEPEKALRFLKLALARDPGDSETLALLARAAEALGKDPEALGYYERALARSPEDADLLLAVGSLHLRNQDTASAKAYFDQLLSLSPDDATLRAKVGFAFAKLNRLDEAVRYFTEAQALAPSDPALSFFLGRVREQLRDWGGAAEAFAAVPQGSELYPQAVVHRVRALSAARAHERAIALAKSALEKDPKRVEYLVGLADASARAGRAGEAVLELERALVQSPSPSLYAALANLYERLGQAPRAVALLERGLEVFAKDETLLFALGAAQEKKGDLEASVARMRELLKLRPDHAEALNFIGYSLADHGQNLEEAEALIRRALALEPENGAYLDSLGWVYFKRGDFQRALEPLERAARLEPEEPLIAEHLGDAYLGLARSNEAREAFKRALHALEAFPDPEQRERLQGKLARLGDGARNDSAVLKRRASPEGARGAKGPAAN